MTKPVLSLFLDRDGVLNKRLPGSYVTVYNEFHWTEGCIEALKKLSKSFDRIFIVTNQQGIGKGLMTKLQLEKLHKKLVIELQEAGIKINRIYFCPDLHSQKDNCRKPAPSMGLQAKKDFPEINFDRAVMIGDSHSDLQFARGLGMVSIWIDNEHERVQNVLDSDYDFRFSSLVDVAARVDDVLLALWS